MTFDDWFFGTAFWGFIAAFIFAVTMLVAGTPPHCEKPVCGMKSCQSFKKR